MTQDWKDIHFEFTEELQKKWQNNGFNYQQTEEWIDIGLKPDDYQFATYLRDVLTCEPEETLNFGDLEALREQHQAYLRKQATDSESEDEAGMLAKAIEMSLGVFGFDDLFFPEKKLAKLPDQELEKYLSEKRSDLKKHFIFNIQELTTEKARDNSGYTAHNGRIVKELLANDLTQLALANGWDNQVYINEGTEDEETFEIKKNILILNKENGDAPSRWESNDLDKKIIKGEELYIIFPKDDSWVDWKGWLNERHPQTSIVKARIKLSLYLKSKKDALNFLRGKDSDEKDHLKSLVKLRTDIPGRIEEITRFETWWNNNLATVINNDGNYWVFLLVYEPKRKNIKEKIITFPLDYSENRWGLEGHNSRGKHGVLSDAQKEAEWLREKLSSVGVQVPNELKLGNSWVPVKSIRSNEYYEHPILLIHPDCDRYRYFEEFVKDPYVAVSPVGSSVSRENVFRWESEIIDPSNWNEHIEPLSIIKVEKREKNLGVPFCHVGIYLGNNEVCHVYDYDEEKWVEARITDISVFLGNTKTTKRSGHIIVYKPIVPFCHYQKIVRRLAWAKETKYRKGEYDLFNSNCEHFANMCVYGINYSEQIGKLEKQGFKHFWAKYGKDNNVFIQLVVKPWWWSSIVDAIKAGKRVSNNGKGQVINLAHEIVEVNSKLKESNSTLASKLEARIQVPPPMPSEKCKLM